MHFWHLLVFTFESQRMSASLETQTSGPLGSGHTMVAGHVLVVPLQLTSH